MKRLKYLFVTFGIVISSAVIAQDESDADDPMEAMHEQQYDPANDPYEQRRAARANNHYEVYNPGGEWAHREESSYGEYEASSEREAHFNGGDASSYVQDYEESDGAYVEIDEGDASADEEDAYPIRNDPAAYEADYLSESYSEQGGERDEAYPSYGEHYEEEDVLHSMDDEPHSPDEDDVFQESEASISLSAYSEGAELKEELIEGLQEQALSDELALIETSREVNAVSAADDNVSVSTLDDSAPSDPVEPSLPMPYLPIGNSESQASIAEEE